MKIQKNLIKTDCFLDYIPVVSAFNNLVNIALKALLQLKHTSSEKTHQKNHYFTHIEKKSYKNCALLMIPFARVGIRLYYSYKKRSLPNESKSNHYLNHSVNPYALIEGKSEKEILLIIKNNPAIFETVLKYNPLILESLFDNESDSLQKILNENHAVLDSLLKKAPVIMSSMLELNSSILPYMLQYTPKTIEYLFKETPFVLKFLNASSESILLSKHKDASSFDLILKEFPLIFEFKLKDDVSLLEYVSRKDVKNDSIYERLLMTAIDKKPAAINFIDQTYVHLNTFMAKLLAIRPFIIEYMDRPKMANYTYFACLAIKHDPKLISSLSSDLYKDQQYQETIVDLLIEKKGALIGETELSLFITDEELRKQLVERAKIKAQNMDDYANEAASSLVKSSSSFKYIKRSLVKDHKTYEKLAKLAIDQDPSLIKDVDKDYVNYRQFMIQMIKKKPSLITHLDRHAIENEDYITFASTAIRNNPQLIEDLSLKLLDEVSYKSTVIDMIMLDQKAAEFIKDEKMRAQLIQAAKDLSESVMEQTD